MASAASRRSCLAERRDPGLRPPEDEGVDVVRALIGVDCLEIHDVADDVELVGDAVAAMHIARDPRDVERLAAIVALQERDHLGHGAPLVLETAEAQARMEAQGDLGLHVDELLLDQLIGGEGPTELLALERVAPRRMPAEFGGAERAPGNAVARVVEAGERAL